MGKVNKVVEKDQIKYIYKITCINNNRVYIGQTYNIKRRFKDHKSLLSKHQHLNKRLQEDYDLYGKDSFIFEIIEEISNKDAYTREDYWIDYYGGIDNETTYNMTTSDNLNKEVKNSIGKSNKGKIRSKEFKLIESKYKKDLFQTDQGKLIKEKISKSLKEFFKTDQGLEQLKKQSEFAKLHYSGENNPMYGKHHSDATKNKISETKKQKIANGEYVAWNKGKKGLYKHSKEARLKLQKSSTKYTPEMINQLKIEYKKLGTYNAVARKYNMNPLCVSRLIRFGTTQMKPKNL